MIYVPIKVSLLGGAIAAAGLLTLVALANSSKPDVKPNALSGSDSASEVTPTIGLGVVENPPSGVAVTVNGVPVTRSGTTKLPTEDGVATVTISGGKNATNVSSESIDVSVTSDSSGSISRSTTSLSSSGSSHVNSSTRVTVSNHGNSKINVQSK